VTVICDDGKKRRNYVLNEPNKALLIPEMIWDEQIYKSQDSVLLVLANTLYNPSDYIENFETFRRIKNDKNR